MKKEKNGIIKGMRTEWKHITWLPVKMVRTRTGVILASAAVMAVLISAFDTGILAALGWLGGLV